MKRRICPVCMGAGVVPGDEDEYEGEYECDLCDGEGEIDEEEEQS